MKDITRIQHDIEATRGRIDDNAEILIDRIAEKRRALSTDLLRDTGKRMLQSIRDNPIPLVVTGVGLGWLILRDATCAHRMSDASSAQMEGPGLADKAKSAAHKVAEGAKRAKDSAARGVGQLSRWFETTLDENPTLLAVATLGLGLAAGLAVPPSKTEIRTAGKVSEKLAGVALDRGIEAIDRKEEEDEVDPGPDYQSGS
jgi:hypothetical protein